MLSLNCYLCNWYNKKYIYTLEYRVISVIFLLYINHNWLPLTTKQNVKKFVVSLNLLKKKKKTLDGSCECIEKFGEGRWHQVPLRAGSKRERERD